MADYETVPQSMTLVQAKEARESLIERLVLAFADSGAAYDSQETRRLATELADGLITSGWVTRAPVVEDEA